MIQLNNSGVAFDSESHTYQYEGKELKGITGMLHSQLFPDMYEGISEDVLANAAEHGTLIHQQCELFDDMNVMPSEPQAIGYTNVITSESLQYVASEYLVTDMVSHATAIDKVFLLEDGTIAIADIKTTSQLNREYVSWQLSIGKMMFELANADLKVTKLYAIWLPKSKYGEPTITEVKEIPQSEVFALLMAEDNGRKYTMPKELVNVNSAIPVQFADIENEIYTRLSQAKKIEAEIEDFKKRLSDAMKSVGAVSWKSERMTITLTKESVAQTFDSKKFKEEHPDEYEQYLKSTKRKGSLKITLK